MRKSEQDGSGPEKAEHRCRLIAQDRRQQLHTLLEALLKLRRPAVDPPP